MSPEKGPSSACSGSGPSGITTSQNSGPGRGVESAATAMASARPPWVRRAETEVIDRPERSTVTSTSAGPASGRER